jgi:hypothetical protein
MEGIPAFELVGIEGRPSEKIRRLLPGDRDVSALCLRVSLAHPEHGQLHRVAAGSPVHMDGVLLE